MVTHHHQKSSGNIDTLSKHKAQHSSSSIGKSFRQGSINKKLSGQNSAIYNSNNQKMVEPQLSTRNAPQNPGYMASMNDTSGQGVLREMPV